MSNTQKKNVPELRFPGFEGEWEEKQLGEVATFAKGKLGAKKDVSQNGVPIILYGELYTKYGAIVSKIFSKTDIPENKLKMAKKNDVLIPSSGETAIDIATASCIYLNKGVAVGGDINILTPQKQDGRFISLSINGINKNELSKYAQGKTVVHLYNNDIKNLKIAFPSEFEEQVRIGNFFSKLDRQIELQEQKLELLQQQKKGYMQKIFSQELRFKDENGNDYPDWENSKIEKYLKERNERSDKGQMLSVTINSGIIKFSELDRKDNSSKDKSNYKVVRKNDIAYNSMRMWQGASGKSNYNGIVSPAYTVLYPTQKTSSLFIGYKFKTHRMIHKFKINSQGLTSDTWNLKYKQLKNINIDIPVLEEQEKIGGFFKKMDILISKQLIKINLLKQQKQAFLQKMFI
ncbi:restriction endonuclease subunit S [Staphylococcus aureus]|uniref:restriction endonuclease subunit S n=1 Tax=Staphylococcus aureus TaxID=1280 RepID=UPI00292BA000|nr:restriction endonuclease subunit S [Staphylococcus aureus]WQJ26502.1 restriction endonuclease subunit S [Staphylococcus aureus]WQJ29169.1 restriction endonuclease subunit S [Staphylococcus aureus]WQJ36451.1 restriction endonuclease subunit S [Staphylococcus aureus]WQJ60121.1 restriction endonuclease subunit S [Staphylococcus aureus]WQJ67834.1 restriction endonuclease subunit S [Staphylococcus aureus]